MRIAGDGEARLVSAARAHALAALAAAVVTVPAHAVVTAPSSGERLVAGEPYTIRWDPLSACSTVDIVLLEGNRQVCTIASDVPNAGSYEWPVADCLVAPACNLRVSISCPGGSVTSSRFSLSSLLLTEIDPGDRRVQLTWERVRGDTLGAGGYPPPAASTSRFAGYNVWRQTFDNQLGSAQSERFTKLRVHDVEFQPTRAGADTSSLTWTFDRPQIPFGRVVVTVDEKPVAQQWRVAQTFTTPPDSTLTVCSVRAFLGRTFGRWVIRAAIVAFDGAPDVGTELGAAADTLGSSGNRGGGRWIRFAPISAPLDPGETYAIVLSGSPTITKGAEMSIVHSSYDAVSDGSAWVSTDNGASWEERPGNDLGYRIGVTYAGAPGCMAWKGQRRAGERLRFFSDPDSIRAFTREDDNMLVPLAPTGPFNGFQLRYAVTAFRRSASSVGQVEFPSACEDTLFTSNGFPLGVTPSGGATWPEVIYPQSEPRTSLPALRDVYPVPNPYVRDPRSPSFPRWEIPGERKIQFVNLPEAATIQLFTLAGDRVRTLEHSSSDTGAANWDLRNEDGEIVVSGIYIWSVKTERGEQKQGQLVIVR